MASSYGFFVDYIIMWTPGCKENNKWENVGYVLYSLHVCVWAHQIRQLRLTIPCSSALFVSCAPGTFLGGGRYAPPSYTQRSTAGVSPGQHPKIVFWAVFAILTDFAIFSDLLN
jgi:hypothetical protein